MEELKNLQVAELFEIEKHKRQLYGRKSERSSLSKGTDWDLKNGKDDFDGSNLPVGSCDESSAGVSFDMNIDAFSHSVFKPADPDDTLLPFCDEIAELVKVLDKATGKFEYRKKYIWGIKNKALKAAKNTSLIYSIIESCKMNELRPVKYIAEVLRKLIFGETDYMALLPMNISNNLIINQKYNSIWATYRQRYYSHTVSAYK